jgi:hypothetical protein
MAAPIVYLVPFQLKLAIKVGENSQIASMGGVKVLLHYYPSVPYCQLFAVDLSVRFTALFREDDDKSIHFLVNNTELMW